MNSKASNTILQKSTKTKKKNDKEKDTEKPNQNNQKFSPFQGKGKKIGSDFEHNEKMKKAEEIKDIYVNLGK
jgi:hypothetical protein